MHAWYVMNKKRGFVILGSLFSLCMSLFAARSLWKTPVSEADTTQRIAALYSQELHHWLEEGSDNWPTPRYVLVYSRPGQLSPLLERLRLDDYAVLYSNNAQQRALLRLSAPEELLRLQWIEAVSVVSAAKPPLTTIEMRRLNARSP